MTKPLSDRKRSALRGQLIAYLAETMPEAQREGFEHRLLDDDAFSQHIHQAQQELLEDYAAGTLSSVHHKQLRPWVFSSSGRRQHVQLTADLLYRARRSRVIVVRLCVGIAAACVLLLVGLRLLHPLQYFQSTSASSTAHVNQPPPPTFTAPSEPLSLDDPAAIASPDAPGGVPSMIMRLVPARVHSESEPAIIPSVYAIRADLPIILQIPVSSGSGCDYSVTIHSETALIPDRHFDHLACVTDHDSQYVEMNLMPGSLSPGQYTVRILGSEGSLVTRFIVHF